MMGAFGPLAATPRAGGHLTIQEERMSTGGLPKLTITNVKTICTAPDGIRLVVVKIETSEPGLYGLGCATFTQRPLTVVTAVEQYLKPFLIGRDPDDIEDIWQASYVSSYWRTGPVLHNAMSGVDEALWDIKGKRANMPVYQLLGGKCRRAAPVYVHASGKDPQAVEDRVREFMAQGFRNIRCQVDVPGYSTYGASTTYGRTGKSENTVWEPTPYVRVVPKLFDHLRSKLGWEVEFLHDIHERIPPMAATGLTKELDQYKLFFVEDHFAPVCSA
jgi:mannonate dehydratase